MDTINDPAMSYLAGATKLQEAAEAGAHAIAWVCLALAVLAVIAYIRSRRDP